MDLLDLGGDKGEEISFENLLKEGLVWSTTKDWSITHRITNEEHPLYLQYKAIFERFITEAFTHPDKKYLIPTVWDFSNSKLIAVTHSTPPRPRGKRASASKGKKPATTEDKSSSEYSFEIDGYVLYSKKRYNVSGPVKTKFEETYGNTSQVSLGEGQPVGVATVYHLFSNANPKSREDSAKAKEFYYLTEYCSDSNFTRFKGSIGKKMMNIIRTDICKDKPLFIEAEKPELINLYEKQFFYKYDELQKFKGGNIEAWTAFITEAIQHDYCNVDMQNVSSRDILNFHLFSEHDKNSIMMYWNQIPTDYCFETVRHFKRQNPSDDKIEKHLKRYLDFFYREMRYSFSDDSQRENKAFRQSRDSPVDPMSSKIPNMGQKPFILSIEKYILSSYSPSKYKEIFGFVSLLIFNKKNLDGGGSGIPNFVFLQDLFDTSDGGNNMVIMLQYLKALSKSKLWPIFIIANQSYLSKYGHVLVENKFHRQPQFSTKNLLGENILEDDFYKSYLCKEYEGSDSDKVLLYYHPGHEGNQFRQYHGQKLEFSKPLTLSHPVLPPDFIPQNKLRREMELSTLLRLSDWKNYRKEYGVQYKGDLVDLYSNFFSFISGRRSQVTGIGKIELGEAKLIKGTKYTSGSYHQWVLQSSSYPQRDPWAFADLAVFQCDKDTTYNFIYIVQAFAQNPKQDWFKTLLDKIKKAYNTSMPIVLNLKGVTKENRNFLRRIYDRNGFQAASKLDDEDLVRRFGEIYSKQYARMLVDNDTKNYIDSDITSPIAEDEEDPDEYMIYVHIPKPTASRDDGGNAHGMMVVDEIEDQSGRGEGGGASHIAPGISRKDSQRGQGGFEFPDFQKECHQAISNLVKHHYGST